MIMKNINRKARFGGALGIIIAIILIVGIIAGAYAGYNYSTGKELYEKQNELWAEAFTNFSQKQPEAAYLKLTELRDKTFNSSLDFYKQFASGTFLTKQEITEAIILICQSEAYDNLFKLEQADNWIQKAKIELDNINDIETRNELTKFITRTESANKLCSTYNEYIKVKDLQEDKYKELVKSSLKIGSEAIASSDYDFTIFEIRFLIACGKSFDEPVLVSEARKQLFDITNASGEDEKTKLLWSLLRN